MRTLEINKQKCWYCTLTKTEAVTDDGYYTGEWENTYSDPVELFANISPVTGTASVEPSGVVPDYDRVIVLDHNPGLTETTVFFIDSEPNAKPQTGKWTPLFDYRVKRIAKSLNFVSIALEKVRE